MVSFDNMINDLSDVEARESPMSNDVFLRDPGSCAQVNDDQVSFIEH